MKLLKHLLLVLILGFLLEQVLPWWSIAIAGFLGGAYLSEHYGRSFLGGLLGIFFLWAAMSMAAISGSDSDLADKFAMILPLPLTGFTLTLFTGFVGGLVAGFASLAGDAVRRIVMPK